MRKSDKQLAIINNNTHATHRRNDQQPHTRGQHGRAVRLPSLMPRRVLASLHLSAEPIVMHESVDEDPVIEFELTTGCCHMFDSAPAPVVRRVASRSTILDGFAGSYMGTWGDPQHLYL
jgi:hypothetical protein